MYLLKVIAIELRWRCAPDEVKQILPGLRVQGHLRLQGRQPHNNNNENGDDDINNISTNNNNNGSSSILRSHHSSIVATGHSRKVAQPPTTSSTNGHLKREKSRQRRARGWEWSRSKSSIPAQSRRGMSSYWNCTYPTIHSEASSVPAQSVPKTTRPSTGIHVTWTCHYVRRGNLWSERHANE